MLVVLLDNWPADIRFDLCTHRGNFSRIPFLFLQYFKGAQRKEGNPKSVVLVAVGRCCGGGERGGEYERNLNHG